MNIKYGLEIILLVLVYHSFYHITIPMLTAEFKWNTEQNISLSQEI